MSASWTVKYLICIGFVLSLGGCGGPGSGDGSGGNGSALVSWTPPTQNSDGSTLEDLAGYRIYYGNSPGSYDNSVTITNPGLSSYQVDGLGASDTYFVMTAVNTVGIESSYSEEIYKRVE
jgi:hypothetical protein